MLLFTVSFPTSSSFRVSRQISCQSACGRAPGPKLSTLAVRVMVKAQGNTAMGMRVIPSYEMDQVGDLGYWLIVAIDSTTEARNITQGFLNITVLNSALLAHHPDILAKDPEVHIKIDEVSAKPGIYVVVRSMTVKGKRNTEGVFHANGTTFGLLNIDPTSGEFSDGDLYEKDASHLHGTQKRLEDLCPGRKVKRDPDDETCINQITDGEPVKYEIAHILASQAFAGHNRLYKKVLNADKYHPCLLLLTKYHDCQYSSVKRNRIPMMEKNFNDKFGDQCTISNFTVSKSRKLATILHGDRLKNGSYSRYRDWPLKFMNAARSPDNTDFDAADFVIFFLSELMTEKTYIDDGGEEHYYTLWGKLTTSDPSITKIEMFRHMFLFSIAYYSSRVFFFDNTKEVFLKNNDILKLFQWLNDTGILLPDDPVTDIKKIRLLLFNIVPFTMPLPGNELKDEQRRLTDETRRLTERYNGNYFRTGMVGNDYYLLGPCNQVCDTSRRLSQIEDTINATQFSPILSGESCETFDLATVTAEECAILAKYHQAESDTPTGSTYSTSSENNGPMCGISPNETIHYREPMPQMEFKKVQHDVCKLSSVKCEIHNAQVNMTFVQKLDWICIPVELSLSEPFYYVNFNMSIYPDGECYSEKRCPGGTTGNDRCICVKENIDGYDIRFIEEGIMCGDIGFKEPSTAQCKNIADANESLFWTGEDEDHEISGCIMYSHQRNRQLQMVRMVKRQEHNCIDYSARVLYSTYFSTYFAADGTIPSICVALEGNIFNRGTNITSISKVTVIFEEQANIKGFNSMGFPSLYPTTDIIFYYEKIETEKNLCDLDLCFCKNKSIVFSSSNVNQNLSSNVQPGLIPSKETHFTREAQKHKFDFPGNMKRVAAQYFHISVGESCEQITNEIGFYSVSHPGNDICSIIDKKGYPCKHEKVCPELSEGCICVNRLNEYILIKGGEKCSESGFWEPSAEECRVIAETDDRLSWAGESDDVTGSASGCIAWPNDDISSWKTISVKQYCKHWGHLQCTPKEGETCTNSGGCICLLDKTKSPWNHPIYSTYPEFIYGIRGWKECPYQYTEITDIDTCVKASRFLKLNNTPREGNKKPQKKKVCFVKHVDKKQLLNKYRRPSYSSLNSNHRKKSAWICKLKFGSDYSSSGSPSITPTISPMEKNYCFSTNELRTNTHTYLENRGLVEAEFGPINSWCTNKATSTASLFWEGDGGKMFNENISDWDLAKVTIFDRMFLFAENFNQDIRGWDVSSAKSFLQMYRSAKKFDYDISPWDVTKSLSFYYMFRDASAFSHCLNWKDKIQGAAKTVLMFYNSPGSFC